MQTPLPQEAGLNGEAHAHRVPEAIDFSPDGYLVTDRDGVIREANYAAAELLQTRLEFLLGKPLPLYIAEDQRRDFYALLGQLRSAPGTLRNWPLRLQSLRKGTVIAVSATVTPLLGQETPIEFHWLLRDVTWATLAERAWQNEKAFADSLLDTAQAIILVLDGQGGILRCNAYLQTLTGHEARDLYGREWSFLLPPAQRNIARDLVWQVAGLGLNKTFNGALLTKVGPERAIAWTAKPLPRNAGAAAAVLVLGHDISELQAAQQHALQVERLAAIGQVMAALAHESRNLLQRSQSCLERLGWRLQDQPEALAIIARVQDAQRCLTRLFDDVRTSAAPLKLEATPCLLPEIWRETWHEVCAAFPDKPAELHEDLACPDLWCSADRFRLGQVFRNILENAFAACPAPVHIDILCREGNLAGRPALRLAIRDHGPGLNAEQRRHIFEPFYTTKARGSGLGMAITRRILEAHGGQIAVGDENAPGTEIILLIPRSPT